MNFKLTKQKVQEKEPTYYQHIHDIHVPHHLFHACGQKLCRVEEHQHQLAHQCSLNIIGIWEWGICGLMGGALIT